MHEYWTVDQVADYFDINPKRAANLMSEHNIKSIRVYPAAEVLAIPRPGQGARTDLKGQK